MYYYPSIKLNHFQYPATSVLILGKLKTPAEKQSICFVFIVLSVLLQITEFKPVPLKTGEDEDYMLALKQELRGTMQRRPHNIKAPTNKAGEEESAALETGRPREWLGQDNLCLL